MTVAAGSLKIKFYGSSPKVNFSGAIPTVTFDGASPKINFSGVFPIVTFDGARPTVDFSISIFDGDVWGDSDVWSSGDNDFWGGPGG